MYVLACSRDVIVEALNTLRNMHPEWPGSATSQLMDAFLDVFDIVDDFDATIPYTGPDPHDRHVHAAAVAAGAAFLLSDDRGFARMESDELPYEVITADQFFVLVDDSTPHFVAAATQNQINYWTSRKKKADLEEHLIAAGCPVFATRVAAHVKVLAGTMTREERRKALGKNEY
jgi:hypothetical protein